MSNREITRYSLFTEQSANGTSSRAAFAWDFRHLWLTVATSSTAFTGTIRVKGSRVDFWHEVDFTQPASQSNPWSYLELVNNDSGNNLDGTTGLVLSAASNNITQSAVNIDWFNWITAEVSWYSAGDVNVDVVLYNNQ